MGPLLLFFLMMGNKRMKKRKKKVLVILSIIILVWGSFFTTDYIRAFNYQSPIFAVPLLHHRDGGSRQYFGIGYKVIWYVYWGQCDDEVIFFIHDKAYRVDIGTWLMPFDR